MKKSSKRKSPPNEKYLQLKGPNVKNNFVNKSNYKNTTKKSYFKESYKKSRFLKSPNEKFNYKMS